MKVTVLCGANFGKTKYVVAEKEVELPFAPFVGLQLGFTKDVEEIVEAVTLYPEDGTLVVECVQESLQEGESRPEDLVEKYRAAGFSASLRSDLPARRLLS